MNQKTFHELLSSMPPLHHTVPGQEFDIEKSQPVNWLLSQPGIKDWLWARMRGTERVQYDKETGMWSGVKKGAVGRPPTAPA